MTPYGGVETLTRDHETAGFDCGSEAQTAWLRRHALQAEQSDTARVYVVCRKESRIVVGYYALAAGSVAHERVPARVSKGIGRYPVPVVILTRLGVDAGEQGRGLGSALVRDALFQTVSIADRVGVRALLIHAETPEAAAFYQRLDAGFASSPTDPLHLCLLMKDLRAAIQSAADTRRSPEGEALSLASRLEDAVRSSPVRLARRLPRESVPDARGEGGGDPHQSSPQRRPS